MITVKIYKVGKLQEALVLSTKTTSLKEQQRILSNI